MIVNIHNLPKFQIAVFLANNWSRLPASVRARLHNEIF